MSTLHLNLKRKWFDIIYSGIKPEEYRNITPYWCNKFLLFDGKQMPKKWWGGIFKCNNDSIGIISELIKLDNYSFINPDKIEFAHAYKSDRDKFTIEFNGFEIREGNPEWGAIPGTKYFVLKLGKILNNDG